MQPQKPKFTIIKKQESLIVTIHGSLDQSICFNSFGGTHRSVFDSFANEIMSQKTLDVNRIFTIARGYNKDHINTMGVTGGSKSTYSPKGCKKKIIY